MLKSSRRFSWRAYRIMHRLVRLITLSAMLAVVVAIYLNLFGVPAPVLRRVVRHFNDAGIPVDMDSIRLSLHGWKAVNVRYYSRHPDDLDPILRAGKVYVRSAQLQNGTGAALNGYRFRAEEIGFTPSMQWVKGFPEESMLSRIDSAELLFSRTPDRVVIQEGEIRIGDVEIYLDGALLVSHREQAKQMMPPERGPADRAPLIEPQIYRLLENELHAIELSGQAVLEVDFLLDAANPEQSSLDVSAYTGALSYRDVPFSRAELLLNYVYPCIRLSHATLSKNNEIIGVKGDYDLSKNEAKAWFFNEISSKRMFLLLPQHIPGLLLQCGIRSEDFPRFDIQFGPSAPRDLLRAVSGSFNLQNAAFCNMELNALSGRIIRDGAYVEIVDLQSNVIGQEHRAGETGSSMIGGSVAGSVFFDMTAHEFGVVAEGSFDPNLLLEPLAVVEVATNVISMFRFDRQPPELCLELGSCYTNWNDFYIGIQGTAEELRLNDVPLSYLSTSSFYHKGVLSLERIVARQKSDFLKGSVAIDFFNGAVDFEGTGIINPKAIEGVAYPRYGIFSRIARVSGDTRLSGRGTVDWRSMKKTSFSIDAAAQQLELPGALLEEFTATVTGDGPEIKVDGASFAAHGGKGKGMFAIVLDPASNTIPYRIGIELEKADFNRYLRFLDPDAAYTASGDLSGRFQADASLSEGFFQSANGSGWLNISNGQLTDLPLFHGLSELIRKVMPSFKAFSINRLEGDFQLREGVIYSNNAYFDGQLLSAKGRGKYSAANGFDAFVQVQTFGEGNLSRILRFFTDPILKLFEMKLEGTLKDPEWKLKSFRDWQEIKGSNE